MSIRISQTQKLALAFHLLRNKLQIKTTKTNWEIYLSSFFAVESILFFTHTLTRNRCIFFFLMFRARGKKLYVVSLLRKRGRKEKCNFGKKTILSSFLFPSPMVPLSPSNTLKGCCTRSLASFEGNVLDCIQSNMYPEPISYPAFSFFLLRWDWENTGRTKKVEKLKNKNDKT